MSEAAKPPLTILMHARDNVAIVANDGGLAAGTVFPSGLALREKVPQAHKVALVDIPEGGFTAMAQMGPAMKAAQAAVAGRAEGGRIAAEVRRQLA